MPKINAAQWLNIDSLFHSCVEFRAHIFLFTRIKPQNNFIPGNMVKIWTIKDNK